MNGVVTDACVLRLCVGDQSEGSISQLIEALIRNLDKAEQRPPAEDVSCAMARLESCSRIRLKNSVAFSGKFVILTTLSHAHVALSRMCKLVAGFAALITELDVPHSAIPLRFLWSVSFLTAVSLVLIRELAFEHRGLQ